MLRKQRADMESAPTGNIYVILGKISTNKM